MSFRCLKCHATTGHVWRDCANTIKYWVWKKNAKSTQASLRGMTLSEEGSFEFQKRENDEGKGS
jgi:hypothetical protein